MCNLLPIKHKKIPKTGEGWKIFVRMDSGRYNMLFNLQKRYKRDDKGGWVTWRKGRGGFCFFLDKSEAERWLTRRNDASKVNKFFEAKGEEVLKRITYDEGMGSFDSEAMSSWKEKPYHIALCKKFKILKG